MWGVETTATRSARDSRLKPYAPFLRLVQTSEGAPTARMMPEYPLARQGSGRCHGVLPARADAGSRRRTGHKAPRPNTQAGVRVWRPPQAVGATTINARAAADADGSEEQRGPDADLGQNAVQIVGQPAHRLGVWAWRLGQALYDGQQGLDQALRQAFGPFSAMLENPVQLLPTPLLVLHVEPLCFADRQMGHGRL